LNKTQLIEKPLLGYLNFLFPIINVLGAIMFLLAYINAWIAMLGLLKILFRKSLTRI